MFWNYKKKYNKMAIHKQQNMENSEIYKKRIQLKRSLLYLNTNKENLMKACFIALYDHRAANLTIKIKTQQFKQKQENLWMRFAV